MPLPVLREQSPASMAMVALRVAAILSSPSAQSSGFGAPQLVKLVVAPEEHASQPPAGSALPGAWWWQVIGVVGMTAMFLGASIPMMEQRSLERRPGYQDVIDRVPMLLPRPPRRS